MTPDLFGGAPAPESYITHVRGVALLPGERINHLFLPDDGLTPDPPPSGRVLVATNQRILAFSLDEEQGDTFIVPLEDLGGVFMKAAARSPAALFQGFLFIVGAIFIYLVLAYWLTSPHRFQIDVPVINMGAGPLVVLAAALLGAYHIGRHYFAREAGSVTFQGANWTFSFPYLGEVPGEQIYDVVNSVFAGRRSRINMMPGRYE